MISKVNDTATAKTQCGAILQWLKSGHSITPIDALNLCGCFRLAARIHDLKRMGNSIVRIMVTNREGVKYASYKLA